MQLALVANYDAVPAPTAQTHTRCKPTSKSSVSGHSDMVAFVLSNSDTESPHIQV